MSTLEILSAQTGSAGFRLPKHDLTQKLLQLANIPVAAPSANLFAHVSPTSPVHVFNDFYDQRVHIIDGGRCENGIESTVVKFLENEL
jgi:L-threonylcarbamoyladenylate synthase